MLISDTILSRTSLSLAVLLSLSVSCGFAQGNSSGKTQPTPKAPATKPNPTKPAGGPEAAVQKVEATEVDFGTYMVDLQRRIKKHWFPPRGEESKRLSVVFKVQADGSMRDLRLENGSGVPLADKAAMAAVKDAAPFRPLPDGAPSEVDIKFTFDYNAKNGVLGSTSLAMPPAGGTGSKTAAATIPKTQTKTYPGTTPRPAGSVPHRSAISLNNDGVVLLKSGNSEAALEKFKEALKLEPEYQYPLENIKVVHNNLAIKNQKDPQKLIWHLHRASYLFPGDPICNANLARAIEEAFAKDPRDFQVRVALGDNALAAKDYAGAIVEYGAALRLKSDPAVRLKLKNTPAPDDFPDKRTVHMLGPDGERIAKWEKVCQQRPNWAEGHVGLAYELAKVEEFTRAKEELDKALKLEPDNAAAKAQMESLKEKLSQADTAAAKSSEAAAP